MTLLVLWALTAVSMAVVEALRWLAQRVADLMLPPVLGPLPRAQARWRVP